MNSSHTTEVPTVQNVNLLLGNNPIECDCQILDFVKYIKKDIYKNSRGQSVLISIKKKTSPCGIKYVQ